MPPEYGIGKIHGVSACLMGYQRTAALLTEHLGFRKVAQEGKCLRFSLGEGRDETMLDIHVEPDARRAKMGPGSVHHVAWRVADAPAQERWRVMLADADLDVTPVLDRQYFSSIYFREPGGILFEIATDGPGFTVDEDESELGTHLKLPAELEDRRESLEAKLPGLHIVGEDRPSAGKNAQSPRFNGELHDGFTRPPR